MFADDAPEQALASEQVEHVFGVKAAAPSEFFPRDFRL